MVNNKIEASTELSNGTERVSRFNLLHEPWIAVVELESGRGTEVSLLELFEHAQDYRCLAGEMKAQDFAVLRILLAILHTVFSRFDAQGEAYEVLELDELMRPLSELEYEDDQDEYEELLMETWATLWKEGKFPQIVQDYLLTWEDRFFLLDSVYPFMQVTAGDVQADKISKSKPSSFSGKNLNRLISESNNKIALFSPRYESNKNKEILSLPELARWVITLHGYTGLADKVIFGKEKYKASKGWAFDLGGLYLSGNNLFETLLMNLVLVHPQSEYRYTIQKPCWEYDSHEVLMRHFRPNNPDNLAELYTRWSRAIYIDPGVDMNEAFELQIVKLPAITPADYFLEPMTLWRYNDSGESKGLMTPRKHRKHETLWRSFGLIAPESYQSEEGRHQKPGVVRWLTSTRAVLGNQIVRLNMISMQDDANATSWVPTDEISDELSLNDMVLTDLQEDGWVPRIMDTVDETKQAVEKVFRNFLLGLRGIRQLQGYDYVNRQLEIMYYLIDGPFREWISGLEPGDSKDERIFSWRKQLKQLISQQVDSLVNEASPRDYEGTMTDGKTINIATLYNSFQYWINQTLNTSQAPKADDAKSRSSDEITD